MSGGKTSFLLIYLPFVLHVLVNEDISLEVDSWAKCRSLLSASQIEVGAAERNKNVHPHLRRPSSESSQDPNPNTQFVHDDHFLNYCFATQVSSQGCKSRRYASDSVVCVCDQSYCDKLEPIGQLELGKASVYESGRAGKRLQSSVIDFVSHNDSTTSPSGTVSGHYYDTSFFAQDVNVVVDLSVKFQEILGFGGAFTDAAGINIASLPETLQDELINSYYSPQGLEYNIGRIPIASCDFSTHEYSYADIPDDFKLDHFQLAPEDFKYKIPYILKAQSAAGGGRGEVLLFGSPWSSPAWMKTNNRMSGRGWLKENKAPEQPYHQSYADYLVRFLEAYSALNMTLWGMTVQNEPFDGFIPFFPFQCLGYSGETERDFVVGWLGPALSKAGYTPDKFKLMIFDDQRLFLKKYVKTVLSNSTANGYVAGVAYHWYANSISPAKVLDEVHQMFPDKFFLASEACEAANPLVLTKVSLGDWGRAESYAQDIIQDLLHWTSGWVDWNLALDLEGGPNYVKNYVDAAIIVNATGKEFYKQPMYYALAHFSKFVPRGSRRVSLTADASSSYVDLAAFETPDQNTVVIALNRKSFNVNLSVRDSRLGTLQNVLPARSMQTYVWKNPKPPSN